MKPLLPYDLVKRSLSAHSVIGLVVAALMYLICLTGTVAVVALEFERWEQPNVAEFSDYNANVIHRALEEFVREVGTAGETIFVVLPTDDLPRMHVANEEHEWWLEVDGSLGPPVEHPWTEMLRDLHISLHLPTSVGVIVVSALGAMLVALIISGLLSHPRIFRDAFHLRLGGSQRLEQADLHNRLAVWGLPFFLMIALTGALFGMLGPLALVTANAFYQGDQEALVADLFGPNPVLDAEVQQLDIGTALAHLRTQVPEARPVYLMVQKLGTRGQFLEIAASLPGRLAFSENYRYNASGDYLGHQGLADGPLGRQMVSSIFRLHFGQFGGGAVLLAYVLLGLALTVVSVSGVNVWLARRGGRNAINALWCATVWGLPLGLVLAAIQSLAVGGPALIGLLLTWIGAMVLCLQMADERRSTAILQYACAGAMVFLVCIYYLLHAEQIGMSLSLPVNASLVVMSGMLWGMARWKMRKLAI